MKPPEGVKSDKWLVANPAEAGEHRVVVSFSSTLTKYARGGGGGVPPSDFVEVEGAWTGTAATEVRFKMR